MSNKIISIIIVNFQSEPLLIRCLASVYNKIQLDDELEVIVVNNDQREDLGRASSIYPKIVIINSPENRGFGAGINLGAKKAAGRILLFLNPDTEILSENINEVIHLFEKDPGLGALGGRLIGEDGKTQKWGTGRKISLINLIINNLNQGSAEKIWSINKPKKVDWVSGTALFARKDVFENINGFDEDFFMYFEDVDLCLRIKKKGGKILYYPAFTIRHIGGKCYSQKDQQKKDYYRSQEHYFEKNRNFIEWLIIKTFQKIFF